MSAAVVQPQSLRGIVKQVLSGDSVIIRGQPKGGPPPERTLNFASVSAPRLARRPAGVAKSEDAKDEPYAWESREFLRKKLVGKEVLFVVEYKVTSGREFGTVYIGKDVETGENITDLMISEGLLTVRREGKSDVSRLVDLEEAAKSKGKGKWATDGENHVRDIVWAVENTRTLVDKMGRKPIQAVVEHVRDGSTIRVFLLPSFHYITLMMSGIRAPGVKLDAEGKPDKSSAEPFSEEARYFTESRLLQRDVEVVLESTNNSNFVGSILHPNGNIAELLLKEGFAKCIDWSMGFVTGGAEKLRAAEKLAKEKKLRIWKDYQANTGGAALLKGKEKEFVATVIECINGDALNVRMADNTVKKIFLASVRPPRPVEEEKEKTADSAQQPKGKTMFRPLYDIPFMFEAREYLRKKLIGKKVNVTVDYIQPASQQPDTTGNTRVLAEKLCCTVKHEGINIGDALVSKGLAKVVRYRQDDDQRASDYDGLLAAEARAQKALKGLHGKKDVPMHHVIDITGDSAKAKQFLPYFQRAGKTTAIVEFIASGSRLRLFVPREMRLITFLLGGISCPRAPRAPGIPGSAAIEGEPYGDEALNFTKDLCLQKEVEIEVDSIDKAGNFIGFLWIDGKNLSVALVEEGLSVVHFTADRTPHFRALQIAEDNAKARRDKIWANYEEIKEELKPEDDKVERKVDPKSVIVTEITSELRLYVQFTDDGDKLENLMGELRRELTEKPPLTGAYTPKKGEVCVARYSADNEWYRAKVEKVSPGGEVTVLFIDYGNRENIKSSRCAQLPSIPTTSATAFAKEFALACVSLPSDEEYASDAINALRVDTAEGKFLLNVEYKNNGVDYVTLVDESSKEDVGERLVRDGLLLVENRKERRLQKLVRDYKAAETEAKKNHNNIWRYGDITEDDAREFGLGR
ncbi:unnamed protein product [Allacma fusca]|uniref:Staphylococcal nuclease domain-containing protein 1 n=1 Tax=Allacma fusca TaxID=39272 RepID=A0A8J2PYS0_9HEXA|nr:unnamed protein product [Allacma fusca]